MPCIKSFLDIRRPHFIRMKHFSARLITLAVGVTLLLTSSYGRQLCTKRDVMNTKRGVITEPKVVPVPINRAVEPFSFDPTNPCAGLSCDGVDDSICTVVVKCGNQIPVFLDALGRMATCKNTQQRLDLKNITSPVPCPADPCAGASCSLYPEAVCFVTECSCKPIWLLPSGVEVNCLPVDKHVTRTDILD